MTKDAIHPKVNRLTVTKLCYAGILIALGVVGSMFSFPIFGSKCAPVQHIINIIAGVTLGPWYALILAFCTSLLRNLFGLGSVLAFPGSMVGALGCGMLFSLARPLFARNTCRAYLRLAAAFVGEVVGTGVLGGMLACPLAVLCGINADAAMFTFVLPFLCSTTVGSLIAVLLLTAMRSAKAFRHFALLEELW